MMRVSGIVMMVMVIIMVAIVHKAYPTMDEPETIVDIKIEEKHPKLSDS